MFQPIETIFVTDDPNGYVIRNDMRDFGAVAYVGLARIASAPSWNAWGSHGTMPVLIVQHEELIDDVDDIDYDTPTYAVDEETQRDWVQHYGTIGLSVIRES